MSVSRPVLQPNLAWFSTECKSAKVVHWEWYTCLDRITCSFSGVTVVVTELGL